MKYLILVVLLIIAFRIFLIATQMRNEEQSMIKTDYSEITELYLVYPEGIKEGDCNYNELIGFYNDLIELIPQEIKLIIFVKTKQIGEKIEGLRANLNYKVNSKLESIWLRDFAGFNMSNKIVKPIFYYEDDSKVSNKISSSMQTLNSLLGKNIINIPLIWDGGNLVTNGKVGIVTERIIEDNIIEFSEFEIKEIIESNLGIKLIIIPELKGDKLAHSDGYLAFIAEDTVLLSKYPNISYFNKDNKYVSQIEKILSSNGFDTIIRIIDNPDDAEPYCEDIESAKGIYVNFLQLNDLIILPEYTLNSKDKYDYNKINFDKLSKFGKVETINCDKLAKFGGVLHCISFTN